MERDQPAATRRPSPAVYPTFAPLSPATSVAAALVARRPLVRCPERKRVVWCFHSKFVRMCVCVYLCTYVRMYVCTYASMHVCTYVRMYVCMYACICIHTHASTCTRTCTCTHHINLRIHLSTYLPIYRPIYLSIYNLIYSTPLHSVSRSL